MKKVVFVGQAMPKVKRNPHDWPSLNSWLYSIGISDEEIEDNSIFSALVDYFPGYHKKGGHLVPTKAEIAKERERLRRDILDFDPEIIVTIGKLSLSYCLEATVDSLDINYIGKSFLVDPYGMLGRKVIVIPLPHPSGASTWKYKTGNKELLEKALKLLRDNLY